MSISLLRSFFREDCALTMIQRGSHLVIVKRAQGEIKSTSPTYVSRLYWDRNQPEDGSWMRMMKKLPLLSRCKRLNSIGKHLMDTKVPSTGGVCRSVPARSIKDIWSHLSINTPEFPVNIGLFIDKLNGRANTYPVKTSQGGCWPTDRSLTGLPSLILYQGKEQEKRWWKLVQIRWTIHQLTVSAYCSESSV